MTKIWPLMTVLSLSILSIMVLATATTEPTVLKLSVGMIGIAASSVMVYACAVIMRKMEYDWDDIHKTERRSS